MVFLQHKLKFMRLEMWGLWVFLLTEGLKRLKWGVLEVVNQKLVDV